MGQALQRHLGIRIGGAALNLRWADQCAYRPDPWHVSRAVRNPDDASAALITMLQAFENRLGVCIAL